MGFFDIFSTQDQTNAANDIARGYTQGYNQLSGLYNQGQNALTTNYMAGLQPLLTNFNQAQGGVSQLMNLLGITPAGGGTSGAPAGGGGATPGTMLGSAAPTGTTSTAAANPASGGGNNIQATLQNLPGYQFTVDQGTQNVLRNQAATGQLNSGATDKAIADYTTNVANQNYTNYVNQLMPFLGASGSAGSGIGGLYSGLGNASANLYQQQGNAAYGTQAGIANAQAQADLAGLTQSGNIWGAGMGAAGLAAGFLSDERAKDDIEPVGELFDGQTVYRYRYKGDPRHQIGLIAQEVEEERPSAVIHDFAGSKLKGVDYKRATNYAAELGRMLEAA